MENHPNSRSKFQTTHWTTVLEAAHDNGERASFASLYLHYWNPLYAYVRRRGYSQAEAEDITQDFFTVLITKGSLSGLQREGGRFRSFLLRMLDNFIYNEWHRAKAQKRGGAQRTLSLNVEEGEACFALEAPAAETPASLFEQRWAFTLLGHVMNQLSAEYMQAGKQLLFERLRSHLQGDRSGEPYAVIAGQCGMSEGALKVAVHRMRHRYGELLRQEIGRTVSNSAEVDEELRYLIRVVSR